MATSYYLSDMLGSSRVVADSNGNLLDDCDFLPYGDERCAASASGNHYQFTGKERDSETGNDYFGARYYGNNLGRFSSPDPDNAGAEELDPQSWNGYAYVADNPVSRNDPSGLSYCQKDSNGNINLSTCVSDATYHSLKNTKGYVHVSEDTSITVNGSQATDEDRFFALSYGVPLETS